VNATKVAMETRSLDAGKQLAQAGGDADKVASQN
jgi:multidrug efflux system membrane fusion protein